MWRSLAVLLLSCASTAYAYSAPWSDRSLAERFAPVLMLHPEERYLPMSVEVYYQHLGDDKDEAFFSSSREAFERGEVEATVAQVSADQRHLQYWFFYPKNGCLGMQMQYHPWDWWKGQPVQLKTFAVCKLAVHEGDWEHVTVELAPDLASVQRVYFSQHDGGVWLDAAKARMQGDHVLAYAALNSHANYPEPELFNSMATIANGLVDALTWIDTIRVGDIVTAPTSGVRADSPGAGKALRWETAHHLVVWSEGLPAAYRGYLGAWGHRLEAKEVLPIPELPDYLAGIVRAVVPVAFAVVPQLRDKSQGEAPPSPWGRQSWQEFDLATNEDPR